jgi:integrase/recombinase XerD
MYFSVSILISMTELDNFLTHLTIERGVSANSYDAYQRDLNAYVRHLNKRQVLSLREASYKDIQGFIASMRRRGLAPSSIARNLSAVRMFFRTAYLSATGSYV